MFKWKAAEKLAQPKITEVIAGDELLTTAIVEEAIPSPLPIAEPLADIVTPAVADEDANSSSEAQMPVALPPKEPATDLGVTAAVQKSEFAETPPELGDRYEVIEFIGSGGMGSVWKVYDKQLEGTFAVKVLKPELLADATAVKRFEKEANLASDLTHSNIAAIFGPGTDSQGRPFIIMGYVDGESLADILAREGKLSEERALDIFTQICEALSHSHMKGIIHRDIKPSNIIISKTESGGDMVHIVDFGIARCIYDEVTKTQALTKAVDIFGSPRYMSPEQFLGNNVTGQSDIYSLGCVFYEMLTGAPPFTDENPVKLILQHISETPDLSKVALKFQSLLYCMLAKEREQRTFRVEDLLEDVASLGSPFSSCQPVDLTHVLLGFALMLLLSINELPSTPHGLLPPPVASFVVLLVWLYVVIINRENAGRSIHYKLLEFNLFLVSVASLITDCFAQTHLKFINLLVVPILAILYFGLIRRSGVIDFYSKCMTAISNRANSWRPRFYRRYQKWFANIGLVSVNAVLVLLTELLLCLLALLVVLLASGTTIDTETVSTVVFPLFAIIVFGNSLVVVSRLLVDSVTNMRIAIDSLSSYIRLQALMSSAVVLVTFALTSVFGNGGFNQLIRQGFEDSKQDRLQVRLEALSYPDTLLANQARLTAARFLWARHKRDSDALALCEQIIASKHYENPVTRASAYELKYQVQKSDKVAGSGTLLLEKALTLLEGVRQPLPLGFDSIVLNIVLPNNFENVALCVGDTALRAGDLEESRRALKLAGKFEKNRDPQLARQWSSLKSGIDVLSGFQLNNSINHK